MGGTVGVIFTGGGGTGGELAPGTISVWRAGTGVPALGVITGAPIKADWGSAVLALVNIIGTISA